jgi:transposase-like protein
MANNNIDVLYQNFKDAHAAAALSSARTCPKCSGRMALIQITPKFVWLPELKTFRCSSCKEVITVEENEPFSVGR